MGGTFAAADESFSIAVRERIVEALELVTVDPGEVEVLGRLIGVINARRVGLIEAAQSVDVRLTSGVWAAYIALLASKWRAVDQDAALSLPAVRELYAGTEDTPADHLLNAMAEVLEGLAAAVVDAEDASDDDDPYGDEEAFRSSEIVARLTQLARAIASCNDMDRAFGVIGLGLEVSGAGAPEREALARLAVDVAHRSGNPDHIAAAAVELAVQITEVADRDDSRRLEAFEYCEIATERIAFAGEQFRPILALRLAAELQARPYLQPLGVPLLQWLPRHLHGPGAGDVLADGLWPKRVSRMDIAEWRGSLFSRRDLQSVEIEIEKARLELEPPLTTSTAGADWVDWTIEHPAYRRAVPHHRSFLNEADFDGHLLVLTHELTHIFCLNGAVGAALTCLRTALLSAELDLWAAVPDIDAEQIEAGAASVGIAPLRPNEASVLVDVERTMELALKAKILQDVWTPWLEGVAIFGEIAADPALDRDRISVVGACLRNIVDFQPDSEQASSPDEVLAQYEQFAAEFEARSSAAIGKRGPPRLDTYLRNRQVPYFAGYLAVRGVCAAWRATARRPIDAVEVFQLLTHATRFAAYDAIPDLSLPADVFAKQARTMMAEWATNLASSLYEPNSGSVNLDRLIEHRLGEALRSLGPLSEQVDRALRQFADVTKRLLAVGTMLPIGRCPSRFFVNIDPASERGFIAMHVRTTEAHASTGAPSINAWGFELNEAARDAITGEFERSGLPRLEITRVIDLAGTFTNGAQPGAHFLAVKYGEWFDVRAVTPFLHAVVDRSSPQHRVGTEFVEARVYPPALARMERQVISNGGAAARRVLEWVDASTAWRPSVDVAEANERVERIRFAAECVLATNLRRDRQRDAASALIASLFGDAQLATDVAEAGFEEMTAAIPGARGDLVDALFETARRPTDAPGVAAACLEARDAGLAFMHHSSFGWDVRAAGTPHLEDRP